MLRDNSTFPSMGQLEEIECFDLLAGDSGGLVCRNTFYYLVDDEAQKGLLWIVGINYADSGCRQVTIINKNRRIEKRKIDLKSKVIAIPKGYEKEDEEALEIARLGLKEK